MSLESLRAAFTSATWPVDLNAAFLSTAGVTPPPELDALLKAAFVLLPGADGSVALTIGQGIVGSVQGDTFSITNATLVSGLFGATAADTSVTLTFTLPDGDSAVLLVQIATALDGGWSFATGFPAMVGDPFSQLTLTNPEMLFATAPGANNSADPDYAAVQLVAGMNFAGKLTLCPFAQSVLVIANLTGAAVPSPLVMSGPFDASGVSDTVIYPVISLKASLAAASFTFLGFTAGNPSFSF
jgi:hypothetical protein